MKLRGKGSDTPTSTAKEKCNSCKLVCAPEVSIKCNGCELWYHLMCSDSCLASHKSYQENTMLNKGYFWFCILCRDIINASSKPLIEIMARKGNEKNCNVSSEISHMKDHIDQIDKELNKKLDALKECFDTSTKTIQNSLSTTAWPNLNSSENNQINVDSFVKKLVQ